MKTRVLVAAEGGTNEEAVREAAAALAGGALVVFPTETVYGVGASAVHRGAMEALDTLKARAPDKPYTLHLGGPEEAVRYVGPLSPLTERLIRKAWPGPLALVVPDRRPKDADKGGLVEDGIYYNGTVGLRCPDDSVGRAILRAAGVPVAASSANAAGRPPPREARQALVELDGKVPLIVDAGPTAYARPSTVVRVREDDSYEILREGAITARRVRRLARTRLLVVCTGNLCRSPMAVGLAKKMLADRLGCDPEELQDRGLEIASCGTGAGGDQPASTNAVETMREEGVDIRQHRSRPMTVDALLAADYIWVMTRGHQEAVLALAPEVANRVVLIDPDSRDVADPIGGDLAVYRDCARHLERAVAHRIQEIA